MPSYHKTNETQTKQNISRTLMNFIYIFIIRFRFLLASFENSLCLNIIGLKISLGPKVKITISSINK